MKGNEKDQDNNGKENNGSDFGKERNFFLSNIMSLKYLCTLILGRQTLIGKMMKGGR